MPVRWQLRLSRPVWWVSVAALGLLLIGCFELGFSIGERRAARRRGESETRVAAAQPPAPTRAEPKAAPKDLGRAPATSILNPLPEKRESHPAPALPPPKEEPRKEAPTPPKPPVESPTRTESAVEVRFAKDVLPVLQAKCVSCHGGLSKRGGLDLRTLAAAVQGGNSGPGVKPGHPDQSPVWETVRTGQMPPPNKPQLTADEKKLLLAWIANGAK